MKIANRLGIAPTAFWPVVLLLGLAIIIGIASASLKAFAAPRQNDFEIQAVAMVDLFGGTDVNCPGCDLIYGPEDEQAALDPATALPLMKFVVKDAQGATITSDNTTSIGGLQSVLLVVPALAPGETYSLELDVPPSGWLLCSQESAKRTLTSDNFQQGTARAEYHFTLACETVATPTPSDQATSVPTVEPGVQPTTKPPSSGSSRPPLRLGAVKGLVFQDLNSDGKLGADEPGLNDVRVELHGGGANLAQVTKAAGTFSFEALGGGEYDVSISPGPEWTVTTPSSYHVRVDGKDVIGNDFGLARGRGTASTASAKDGTPRLPKTGIGDLTWGVGLLGAALALVLMGAGGRLAERRAR